MFNVFDKWDVEVLEVGVEFVHPDESSAFYDLYIVQDDETTVSQLVNNLWKKYNEWEHYHEMFVHITPKYGDASYWRYDGYTLELV